MGSKMKLDRISLRNFRQFYGEQELACSRDDDKNVTLIHAENGVGKTTLLNSILWAFYGETTNRFEHKEQIINFEAVAEAKNSASASIYFDLNDKNYVIQRHHTVTDQKPSERLAAFRIEQGVHKNLPAAETFINSVLPKEMAPYFFFDGEHAEAFAAETNYRAVGKAIRSMLGCEVAETAIADLKAIANDFAREMGNAPGDEERQNFERERNELQTQQDKDAETEAELERDIEALQEQLGAIETKLRETAAAKEIQELRDVKSASLRRVAGDISAAEEEILRWLGSRAVLLISGRLAKQTLDFIDEASLRGRIPSPYNEEFVKGLLDAKECICHRPLIPGSLEYGHVMSLVKQASNAEIMGRVVRARARVQQINEMTSDAPKLLAAAQAKLAASVQERMRLEQELAEISKTLENMPVAEIAEREAARMRVLRTIGDKREAIGGLRHRMQGRQRQLGEIERNLDRLASRSERTLKFKTRRDLAKRCGEMLSAALTSYEDDARVQIQRTINKILEETARRDYRFRFDDTFRMQLLFPDGRPVPRSGGENQLMSLTFTSALVAFARLRANASGEILTPGTIAPLVLDSPFGQLDTRYRESTAKFIPQMAAQVILLVSSSQGDDTVLKALEPYVGAEYLLVSENRGARGTKPEDMIILRNREYRASVFDQPRTMTRIERVQ